MNQSAPIVLRFLLLASLVGGAAGCSELQARRHARQGNIHFKDGDYAAAVEEYAVAEELRPGLPVVSLNMGLACRQMMTPGAKSAANKKAVDCALKSFSRLKEVEPQQERGEQLYIQTLFDADQFGVLAGMYERKLRAQPNDLPSINALIQVYSRAERWDDAFQWTARRADLQPRDAEAQYSVGVFIHNLLFQKGGNGERATFDPRPPAKPSEPPKVVPVFAPTEISGTQRIELADRGIRYLEKAVAVRPQYGDAMVYLGLIYRQKAMAFFDKPADWQTCMDSAENWRQKAIQLISATNKGPAPRP